MEQTEQSFRRYLSQQNLKYTPERRKIFKEIFDAQDHFDAEELFVRLRGHQEKVSRATVYRTLELLVKLGLVRKVCLGDRSSLYENNVNWQRHGHLICIECGKIQEFNAPAMEELFEKTCKKYGFFAQNRCIQISGYCEDCKKRSIVNLT